MPTAVGAPRLVGDDEMRVTSATYEAALLTLATAAVSVSNLIFSVLIARVAGSRQYSQTGTLLALGTAGGFIAVGAQYAIADRAARFSARPTALLKGALLAVWPWAMLTAMMICVAVPLASYLRLDSPVPLILSFLLFAVVVVNSSVGGILIGHRRFQVLATLMVSAAAIRLALGPLLARGPRAATGALLASVIPVVFIGLIAIVFVLRGTRTGSSAAHSAHRGIRPVTVDGMLGAVLAAGIWGMWNLPLALARHGIGDTEAGDFTAQQLLATGILYSGNALVTVAFPRLARNADMRTAMAGLSATAILLMIGSALLVLLGPFIVPHLYGAHYTGSTSSFLALSISLVAVGAANYVVWMQRAMRQTFLPMALALVVGLVVEAVVGSIGSETPVTLGLGPGVAVLASGAAYATLAWSRRDRAPEELA